MLREMGIHLIADDFGTGYSSLSYLRLFAVDGLKIDRIFIRDPQDESEDAAPVKVIINMAQLEAKECYRNKFLI